MKVTLRLQFITAYLLLVICIFALINTYGYSLTYNYLETKKEQQISSEAYYLTSHYASTQGTPEDGAFTLQKQSTMLSSLFDTRVWLVSPTGTILSDSSADGDALSTTCYVLGLEKGMKLIQEMDDVEAIFVTKDGEIHRSY